MALTKTVLVLLACSALAGCASKPKSPAFERDIEQEYQLYLDRTRGCGTDGCAPGEGSLPTYPYHYHHYHHHYSY